ncbi:copper resistance D family protein [Cognatishimia sp. F0-27]|uniref:copper resistance D family protein n=1 Tax=Cognatishimia sp. F0-27 TaxID=2816855 RepID=UPI001D0C019D|nr:CopD family protein [Cognatishimia sp. F0-27]MCC1492816.1 CopD family protein [Cognatishimia sp. F0-27]
MLAALTSADAVTWLSISVKAFAYAATLSAVGSVLVLVALRDLSEGGRSALRWTAVFSALAAGLFTALRLPVRASFLMGGTWDGATDPMILGMVADSPLGNSAVLRLVGLALILAVLWRARAGLALALTGACIASASFALRGHALGEPQLILGALITIHILCLAFWVGAFAPLARAARRDPPARAGALAHEFGRRALWAVGLLVLAGGITLALLGAATPSALTSPYGQVFVIKLMLFAGLLSLAAVNKLKLTPALLDAAPGAGTRLRRSIGVEAGLVAGILVTTAALTTLFAPPGNADNAQATLSAPVSGPVQQTFGDAS